MLKPRLAALLAAVALAAPLSAQQHDMSPAIVAALAGDVEQVEQKMIALAEAIPEASWGWRPAEGVRSIGEVVMHVAADNYFIPAIAGTAAPAETGILGDSYQTAVAYESRPATKAEAIEAMRQSFAHVRAVMAGIDHAGLMANHNFFGNQMSGTQVWVLTATHLHEHLGQLIAYARSNGVVPPWSRQ